MCGGKKNKKRIWPKWKFDFQNFDGENNYLLMCFILGAKIQILKNITPTILNFHFHIRQFGMFSIFHEINKNCERAPSSLANVWCLSHWSFWFHMPWVGKGSYNRKYYKHAFFYRLFFTEMSQRFDECLKTLQRMIDTKKKPKQTKNKTSPPPQFSPLNRNWKIFTKNMVLYFCWICYILC